MRSFGRRVRPGGLPAVAAAIGSLVFAAGMPAPTEAQQRMALAERVKQCGACHGGDGNAKLPSTPSLAGQPEYFLVNQLVLIREGVRPIDAMTSLMAGMSDEEIQGLSAHYSKLPARASAERLDPGLVERGRRLDAQRRCTVCHMPSLVGQEHIPRLARQRVDYLVKALKDIRDNRRRGADSTMTAAVLGASDDDLLALAHFAAGK